MTETNKTNSSSEIISSGKQANVTGNALERFVEHVLTEHDYTEFINHKDQVFAMRHTIGGWLRGQAGKERALIGVYTMSEFQIIVNKNFLG